MNDNDIMDEITAIWNKLSAIEKSLSSFFEMMHAQSTNGIDENGNAILDIANLSDENSSSIIDIADALNDIDKRVRALEGEK